MYFVLTDSNTIGLALTLSRVIQIILGFYFISFILKKEVKVPNPLNKYYKYYIAYILTAILSSLIGGLYYESYNLNRSNVLDETVWFTARIWRGVYTRPFVEFVILLYYFIYFVVIPRYIILNKNEFRYLIDLIIILFKISLYCGILDVGFFLITGNNLIARHLFDSSFIELGTRYHGFAGEPRDAFPYLVFGLTVYILRTIIFKVELPSKLIIFSTLLALVLTQSASGLIGVCIALILYITYNFKINLIKMIKFIISIILTAVGIYFIVNNTDRLKEYLVSFYSLYDMLKNNEELPLILLGQSSNIFPIWQQYQYLINFDFSPIIIGLGIGSSNFINVNFGGLGLLANPQSNLIRILYEGGLLGLGFYVLFQLKIIKYFLNNIRHINKNWFYYSTILLVGLCLAHRSTTIFILCGLLLSIIEIQNKNIIINKKL